ncbi:hypothetical protein K2X89_10660 [Myxococcota bacterium]|nr:hypothetical protein [Myxococcota bacterium]
MKWKKLAIALIFSLLSGCTSNGRSAHELVSMAKANERTRCETDAEVLAQPSQLVARARAAAGQNDLETAYCRFAVLHTLHPESPEAREAFPIAAYVFKGLYQRRYYHDHSSNVAWLASEPRFMFDWLATFFDDDAFPTAPVMGILHDMPGALADDLKAYIAEGHGPISSWRLTVSMDNGRIAEVTGERVASTSP